MATEPTTPAETKTDAPAGLPPSPLAGADAAKHEGAPKDTTSPSDVKADAPAPNGGDGAPKPAEKPAESKAEPSAPKGEPPPAEAPKPESPAESGEKKPPETKADAKKEGEGETPKPEGDKPKETQAETKPEKTEPEAPKEPKAPPTYDKLTLPETVKLDDARIAKLDEILGKAELTGAQHDAMALLRQDLVNMHIEELQRVVKEAKNNQINVWNRLVEQRVNDLKNDPELGGNRIETSLGNAKYALESLIPGFTKEDAAEWIKAADDGGVSHHRLTVKMLNAIFKVFAEPEPVHGNPPNANQSKEAGSRGWYDKVDTKAPAA